MPLHFPVLRGEVSTESVLSGSAELAESPVDGSKVKELKMKLNRARGVVLGLVGLLAGVALLPRSGFSDNATDAAVEGCGRSRRGEGWQTLSAHGDDRPRGDGQVRLLPSALRRGSQGPGNWSNALHFANRID